MERTRLLTSSPKKRDCTDEVRRRKEAAEKQIKERHDAIRRAYDEKVHKMNEDRARQQREWKEKHAKELKRQQEALQRRMAKMEEDRARKKEILEKNHAATSRLATNSPRKGYAFGSSTPRELSYLDTLPKDQQAYDKKLVPGPPGKLTAGVPQTSFNKRVLMNESSMTTSMYVPSPVERNRNISNMRRQSTQKTLRVATTPNRMTQSVYTPSRHPTETVRERLIKKPTTMTASMPNTPLGIAKSSSPLVTSKKTSLPPRNISTTVTPKKPAAKLRRTLPSMREFIPTISQPITPTVQEETELSLEKEFSPSILTEQTHLDTSIELQVNSDTLNDSVSICVPLQSEIELVKIDLMPATIHTDKMDTLIDITSESEEPSSIKEKAERKEIAVSANDLASELEEDHVTERMENVEPMEEINIIKSNRGQDSEVYQNRGQYMNMVTNPIPIEFTLPGSVLASESPSLSNKTKDASLADELASLLSKVEPNQQDGIENEINGTSNGIQDNNSYEIDNFNEKPEKISEQNSSKPPTPPNPIRSSEVLQKLEEESKAAEERKARVAAILAKSRANGRVSPPSAPTNDSRLISQSELQSTDVSDVLKRLASNSNLPMLQKLIARHASDPKLTEQAAPEDPVPQGMESSINK